MWKSPLHLDKYLYARTNPYMVRLLALGGIISALLMGYGFWNFLQIRSLYLIIFGPVVFLFILNKILRYFLQLFYQRFDIDKHTRFVQKYWSENPEPKVAIFLPWAGEDLAVHEEVLKSVATLDYKNYNVYMLDDVGSDEHRALAEKYNFTHLSRPNKGENKKSGNLQYGYDHSTGEFVLILDADFIPIHDILRDLVPYIATDPKIGILQTPQYFEQSRDVHNRSKVEFGGGNIVEDFYRIVMPCRDEFNAAMCVGTSALYKRDAIDKLDGTPKVHASEDLATGLLVTQFGYYVKYLPLIVSMGKSPESYQGYFKQHMRWCSGNLVFAKYWPTARLSLPARLVYLINPMHYLSEASTVFFSFQFLVLLMFHDDTLTIQNTLYFLPYIVLTRILSPLHKSNKSKIGTKLAALNNSYTYFYTYIRLLVKGLPTWQPTGIVTNALSRDFVLAFSIGTIISATYIILFIAIILMKPAILGNYHTYAVIGWSLYSVLWHALFLTSIAKFIHPYRIAQAQNALQRLFVQGKTHAMLFLFAALTGTVAFNGFTALSDDQATTVVAVRQFAMSLQENQTKPVAIAAPPAAAGEPAVLAAYTHPPTRDSYTFTVQPGDSKLKIAKRAVNEFADEFSLTIPEEVADRASYVLYASQPVTAESQHGDEVLIPKESVLDAVEIAMAE